MATKVISAHEAAVTLYAWGVNSMASYGASGFMEKLLEAISKADVVNREKLRLGFPGLVAAQEMCEAGEYGPLTAIAAGVEINNEPVAV